MNRVAIIAAAFLLLLPVTAFGQSRTRRSAPKTAPKTTAPANDAALAAVKTEGATRVANQIKNLTAFLYLLGGVAKDLDAQAPALKEGTASPTQQRNQARIIATFEDFRIGLDALETHFSSSSELRPYYVKLLGSADAAATAKAQAAGGQVERAGNTLLGVVGKLTDFLVLMR